MSKKNKNKGGKGDDGRRVIATNRRARHDYHIERTVEAGLVLKGTEVKSLREGKASLVDSYAAPEGGEMWVTNVHIPPYDHGNRYNVETKRARKLLLHRSEIDKLAGIVSQTGYTLIPLQMYFDRKNRVKIEIGVCRGKRDYDKRQAIRERDVKREQDREVREYFR